ncbi:cuticle protein 10.9-like [Rhipicephalus microplus]|uniref:cuticle protein 10.9-like n=1 Tax=Rhipicephalus microplus TaxID=6941 RepID=UPI003F6DA05D
MNKLTVLLASSLCALAVQAGYLGHGAIPTYVATQQVYYKPQPYKFGYEIKDAWGNTQHRHEVGDEYNTKRGSYGFTDAHGIYRRVEYVADSNGFRAIVKTNEPGTKTHHPAHALYHSNAPEHIVHNSQQDKEQLEVPIYVDAIPQHTLVVAPVGDGHHGYH